MWANGFLSEYALFRFLSFRIESFVIREWGGRTDIPMNILFHYFSYIVYHIRDGLSREFWKNNLKVPSMAKRKTPLQEVLERGAPEYFLFHCRCAILVSSPQASAGFLSINSTICSQGACFLVFPRRHRCSIFATHWAMTLFSNVRYTSTLTVVTGTPLSRP